MDELEQYREAVVPLRQADFGLVREAMGIMSEMSPTMALIAITAGNLLEIFDPHEPIEVLVGRHILETRFEGSRLLDELGVIISRRILGDGKDVKKVRWFTCWGCNHKLFAFKEKRKCPKCGGKLKKDAD